MDPSRASNYGPGDFRIISERNRIEDQKRIHDLRGSIKDLNQNTCKFPTRAYVINMEQRKDRWERFSMLNDQLKENFKVSRFSAIENPKDVPLAIFKSFISVMEEGFIRDGQEAIVVMEDDSYLALGAIEKIKKSFDDLPGDWDILIGNHYFFGEMNVLTDNIAKPVGRASTLNFSIIRNTTLDKVTNNMHLRDGDVLDFDHFVTSPNIPINNYTIWPMVSREYLSYSDHKSAVKDMTVRVRENAYLFPFIDGDTYYPSLECW